MRSNWVLQNNIYNWTPNVAEHLEAIAKARAENANVGTQLSEFTKAGSFVLLHLALDTSVLTLPPASRHPFSHVCYPLHMTPTSQHSSPTSVVHLHASMCHGACHSCASARYFHICCSSLQSYYDSCHMFTWPDMCHALRHTLCLHPCMCQLSSLHYSFNITKLKFIVQYCHIPQAIVACWEVIVISISIPCILIY